MKLKLHRVKNVLIVFTVLIGLISLPLIAHFGFGLLINISESTPLGIYQAQDLPLVKGQLVPFCPPIRPDFDLAMKRKYFGRGNCPGGYGVLIKRVMAEPGDKLSIQPEGIWVNEKALDNTRALKQDKWGYLIEQKVVKNQALKENEYLFLNEHPQSYDGRYFGPIAKSQIISALKPVWTW